MTIRLPFRGDFASSPVRRAKPKSAKKSKARRQALPQDFKLEVLEDRVVPTGPQLVSILPNTGLLIQNEDVLTAAPEELTFRFNQGQNIDPDTLGAITIQRSGFDDTFGDGNEISIVPGYVGIGDEANEVIMRFAESLPDDRYQIQILGSGSEPLSNTQGEAFNNGTDLLRTFDLDLAPQVLTVVPQPILRDIVVEVLPLAPFQLEDGDQFVLSDGTHAPVTFEFEDTVISDGVTPDTDNVAVNFRGTQTINQIATTIQNVITTTIASRGLDLEAPTRVGASVTLRGLTATPTVTTATTTDDVLEINNGGLVQSADQIIVYFNADELDATTAEDVDNYQLLDTSDDSEVLLSSVSYTPADPANGITAHAVLNLQDGDLDPGTYRLRIGGESALPTGTTVDDTITVDPGDSSFATATDLSNLAGLTMISAAIDPEVYGLALPGALNEPGHRDIAVVGDSHYWPVVPEIDSVDGIQTIEYNFQDVYGIDPDTGGNLVNQIDDNQMARAREIFDLFGEHLGLQVVETADQGMTVVTGDMRAINTELENIPLDGIPSQINGTMAIMDASEPWGDSEYGGYWFQVALSAIGGNLGFGITMDLPDPNVWGGYNAGNETIFPSGNDLIHGQHLYRPESTDIDVYRFEVNTAGELRAEIVAERLADSSLLDSVLTLYGEYNVLQVPGNGGAGLVDGQAFVVNDGNNQVTFEFDRNDALTNSSYVQVPFATTDSPTRVAQAIATAINGATTNGKLEGVTASSSGGYVKILGLDSVVNAGPLSPSVSYDVVARNDDYFSNDSFVRLDVQPGTYYVAVTSTGNTDFDPTIADSGFGGTTQGEYSLHLDLRAVPTTTLLDTTGTALDGDADGQPGGGFDFWFQSNDANTIYVDKANNPITNTTGAPVGSLANPFREIDNALAAVGPLNTSVRIVGNGGTDGNPGTLDDNFTYQLGLNNSGTSTLVDGVGLEVPTGVTVMIDAGATFKLQGAKIEVGSSATTGDHSTGALQVLGVFDRAIYDLADATQSQAVLDRLSAGQVHFNSFRNDTIGGNNDGPSTGPHAGDWAGIVFRNDSDREDEGIFLNCVVGADLQYGGGSVTVSGQPEVFAPIHLEEARPTIAHNVIQNTADAAISADPNSFEETLLTTYDRIGPDIHGNRLIDNDINGLFIRIHTELGQSLDRLELGGRWDDTDIVHVLAENLIIAGTPGGPLTVGGVNVARPDARLEIDPGVIVKLSGARIEAEFSSQLIAEGTEAHPVIFTSLLDDTFGAGGAFDTTGNGGATGTAGDWGGLYFSPASTGSIDHALIAYGGGPTAIRSDTGFDNFNAVEIHQADVRIANSTLRDNDDGLAGSTRNGRGDNRSTVIFVRGAQPTLLNNVIRDNRDDAGRAIAAISIDVNSLTAQQQSDIGRATGTLDAFGEHDDNYGPLIRANQLANNDINGLVVRGGTLTTESVWDDTDIVHVVFDEIVVDNYHTMSGLRLQSGAEESLVVKLQGSSAGFTASGVALDIDDRIGGTVQVVGSADYPVVLTSLYDNTVGAGLDPAGNPLLETVSPTTAADAGDWRGILFDQYANDRNVWLVNEAESSYTGGADLNSNAQANAEFLGNLAPDELSGDENRALGFDVHGLIALDDPTDVDVYKFTGEPGTEIWIDIDRTSYALDSVVELLDGSGNLVARSNNSLAEQTDPSLLVGAGLPLNTDPFLQERFGGATGNGDLYSTNPRDAGMHAVLPGTPAATPRTYFVRVRSASSNLSNLEGGITHGQYQLQIRLRQTDEVAGSTVHHADIRYATNAIDISGLPAHSPLLGEAVEQLTSGGGDLGSTVGSAQDLGNIMTSDRNVFSVGGQLHTTTDIDYYQFTVDYDLVLNNYGNSTFSAVFDLDYASGLTRPDTVMGIFDSAGRLIYIGRDSNIHDDRPLTASDDPAEQLSRGSEGPLDPYLGTLQLTEGNYYVAIASNGRLPTQLNQTFLSGAANTLVRLEPVNSISRIAEDHIGFDGYTSGNSTWANQVEPEQGLFEIDSALSLSTNVVPFTLSDVVLYVSINNGEQLVTVDAFTGIRETTVGDIGPGAEDVRDLAMRSDGRLFGAREIPNDTTTSGALYEIDAGNASQTLIGNDNIDDAVLVSDWVAALAYQRTAVGSYNLYYAAVSGGSSTLFRANPDNGSAEPVTGQPWGIRGAIYESTPGDLGITRGMAFLGNTLYGVAGGKFFRIDTNTGRATNVVTIDPSASFNGLALGPQNVEGGAYAQTFFACTDSELYAFAADGSPRFVFDSNQDGVADSNKVTAGFNFSTGLAFSPVDYNLWHPTMRQGDQTGHGINAAADDSRSPGDFTRGLPDGRSQDEAEGGASFYFGIEEYASNPTDAYFRYDGVNAQYGVRTQAAQQDLTSNTSIGNNYNAPGGALGSLQTNAFSLAGYTANDKPTLYFNYFLDTQNAGSSTNTMRDSARVLISADGGASWSLLATNNSTANVERPTNLSTSGSGQQRVQELFDADQWRQARVDLGEFAGQPNLVLRFDFSTAGSMNDAGDPNDADIPGDQFGNPGSAQRGQSNTNEGFYIDDIIIGFAERGEMVTGAAADAWGFSGVTGDNNANPGVTQILQGPYQFEIRRGTEYSATIDFETSPENVLFNPVPFDYWADLPGEPFNTNDRLADGYVLRMVNGASIQDAQSFSISDGITTVTFEFDLGGGGVATGNEPIVYDGAETAAAIAQAVTAAINGVAGFGVTATTKPLANNSNRIELVGATNVTESIPPRNVTVTIDADQITEDPSHLTLPSTAALTVTLDAPAEEALTVSFATQNGSNVTGIANVDFAIGEQSHTIIIQSFDDDIADGHQTVTVMPVLAGYHTIGDSLDVLDDDSPTLVLSAVGSASLVEGTGTTVRVTRNDGSGGELTVFLTSTDSTELRVPTFVTIPDGADAVEFQVDAVQDGELDGDQSQVLFFAHAAEFVSDSLTLEVTDSGTIAPTFQASSAVNVSAAPFAQSDVTIAVNPTDPNNLIAVANDLSGGTQDMTWYSTNGGGAWTASAIPNRANRNAGGQSTVVFDRLGNAYVGHLDVDAVGSARDQVVVGVSNNGGQSWSVTAVPLPAGTADAEKPFLAIGPDPANLSQDLLHVGYHVGNVQFVNNSSNGVAWGAAVQVSDGTGLGTNAQLAVDSTGAVYFAWQEIDGSTPGVSDMLVDKSIDGGITWGTDVIAYTTNVAVDNDPVTGGDYTVPAAPDQGIGSFLSIAVDRSGGTNDGNVYLALLDQGDLDGDPTTGHDNTDIFVIRSTDGGTSWSSAVRVNNASATGAGRLFAATSGNNDYFYELDPATGAEINQLPVPGGFFSPLETGIAFDGSTVYYMDSFGFDYGTIYELHPESGAVLDSTALPAMYGTGLYSGLAANDGKVYILVSGADELWEYDPVTDEITNVLDLEALNPGSNTPLGGMASAGIPGKLLVTELGGPEIMLVDTTTGVLTSLFQANPGTGPLTGYFGMGVIDGEIYLGHAGLNKIDVFGMDGTFHRTVSLPYGIYALGADEALDPAANTQFAPTLSVDQTTGAVGIAWYDARYSLLNQEVQVFFSASFDGGQTFGSDVQVAQGQSDQSQDNAQRSASNYGDMLGLSYNNQVASVAWSDNSGLLGTAAGNLDVFYATVTPVVPETLTVEIAADSVAEGGATSGVVRRTGATTGNLTVNLSSTDSSEGTLPATVTIPAGSDSVTFTLSAVDDSIADGTQTVFIEAQASGFATVIDGIDVTDAQVPQLSLSITGPTTITETDGRQATWATVSRNTPTSEALVVTLFSHDPSEASVPTTVTIPAGLASITFAIDAVDDLGTDGDVNVTITALASGHLSASVNLTVQDVADAESFLRLGDRNQEFRDQSQVIISNNQITSSSQWGIRVEANDAGVRNLPELNSLPALNDRGLAPGVVITNNLIVGSGTGGISFSGSTDSSASVPYGRIVNNTIYNGTVVPSSVLPIVSSFDTDDEGWLVNPALAATANFVATGGNPGGYLEVTDGPGVGLLANVTAPSKFLGDLRVYDYGTLSFDTIAFEASDTNTNFGIVEISNGIDTASYQLVPNGEPLPTWTTYTATFSASTWGVTQATWDSILAAVTEIRVILDYVGAVGESAGFDNFTLTPAVDVVARGTGMEITDYASPTILNNIVAGTNVGIDIDSTSSSTVYGFNTYQNNGTNVRVGGTTAGLGTSGQALSSGAPLFVDAANGNFYLVEDSQAVDSSRNSLEDRTSLVAVKAAVGISESPILAPDYDLIGQKRADDPDTPNAGGGADIFRDRGALERIDFAGPTASLLLPEDNDEDHWDNDFDENEVLVNIAYNETYPLTDFVIQLVDEDSSGIDDLYAALPENYVLTLDGQTLLDGVDYFFTYDAVRDRARFTASANYGGGVFPAGTYQITLRRSGANHLRDKAGNAIQPNQDDLSTSFTIVNDTVAPVATITTPLDNGTDDTETSVDILAIQYEPASIEIALDGTISAINDISVSSTGTTPVFDLIVTHDVDGPGPALPTALVLDTDFAFFYDSVNDVIRLTPLAPLGSTFPLGQYTIQMGDGLEGGLDDIEDVAQNRVQNGNDNTWVITARDLLVDGGTAPVTLALTEDAAGSTDTFTVALSSAPAEGQEVRIDLTTNGQVTAEDQANPGNTYLLFDDTNWSVAQTVVVTAIDDAIDELDPDPHAGLVTLTSSSADLVWNSVLQTVAVEITDNDQVGLVTDDGGDGTTVYENGATDTFTVTLNSQPTGDVTVTLSPDAQVTAVDSADGDMPRWSSRPTIGTRRRRYW